MTGQTIRITSDNARMQAHRIIQCAPLGVVVNVREAKRSQEQNDKMWAMLSDVSRSKPEGRHWNPETWKAAFMHALGHQIHFAEGLDNSGPFPLGFRSSRLTKAQMADLITCIQEYGDRHGVVWSEGD